jgi:hypothetical protein
MSTVIGTDAATQTSRERTYAADGSISDTYTMPADLSAGFIATYTLGTSAIGTLKLAEIKESISKGVAKVSLRFVTPSSYSINYGGSTEPVKSADCAAQELPIEEHPDFSGLVGAENVESFLTPSPTYEYSDVVNSFTFSEANIISGVGKRSAPTGMTSPTTDKWLKVSRRVSPEGEKFRVTDVWQYNPNGIWNTTIYPA